MKVINFYGQPGAGKSTLAAALFVEMKKQGYKVELINEYAKDLLYEDRFCTIKDQLYVLAKQNHKLISCQNKNLDFVISDSPIILSAFYADKRAKLNHLPLDSFKKFIFDLNNSYDRINFFIERNSDIKYQQIGRFESEEESNKLKQELISLVRDEFKEKLNFVLNTKNININNILEQIKELE